MLKKLDVFIFTLGLTESWRHKPDGAILPLAPGVSGGEWDPKLYEFHNENVDEATENLLAAIDLLRTLNTSARVILTVSPVPLIATYSKNHVLSATVYSKSVLRVVAEQVASTRDSVAYFPSYEIVTATAIAHRYFEPDLRSVNELGVAHVMRCFFDLFVDAGQLHPAESNSELRRQVLAAQSIICEEDAIERLLDHG
jgi:hypothetical protein